ncbi:MAG: hypothetical protein KDB77_03525 [Flavobacteriales bacterium]|nr:hypothetical protein [Flavobacteriales bacterium]
MIDRTLRLVRTLTLTALLTAPAAAWAGPLPKKHVFFQEHLEHLDPALQEQALDLCDRMNALLNTDRNDLTRAERRELRHEWRSLKAEMDQVNEQAAANVIVISTTGLIIILLLLIILL